MAEFIDTYCHQNRIGAIVRFSCNDGWTFKTPEFQRFSQEMLRHFIATDSDEPALRQSYFRNPESTISDELDKISKDLGVTIKLIEYQRLQIEDP